MRLRVLLATAALLATAPAPAARAARVTDGIVAYYPFSEGDGALVYDRSPTAPHTDLAFEGGVAWIGSGNGVDFVDGRIGSLEAAGALVDALQATGHASFEVWIAPANVTQGGPARILDVSNGPNAGEYDYVLGQIGNDVEARLRHTGKNASLQPRLTTSNHFLTTGLVHLVHVFDGTMERLYVNGVQHPTTVSSSGSFSNWSDARLLSVGNTPTLNRGWSGAVRTVAIYDRALTPAEITQNFQAGADVTLTSAVPLTVDAGNDQVTPSAPGMSLLSTTLRGVVEDPDAVGPIASLWTQISGPTPVVFDDASSPETTVTLPMQGSYVFELGASDEIRATADRVTVVVPSQTGSPSQNLFPADASFAVSLSPTLELDCPPLAPEEGQFLIAADEAFSSLRYDSGASPTDVCSHVTFADLAGPAAYWWSGRQKDASGIWSAWSTPTSFSTGVPEAFSTLSFQDGVDGYAGTRDADIRGDFQNPLQAINEWNQGAQDILRTGRRPPGEPDEMYRSLVHFELSGIDPEEISNAWLELTGWMHNGPPDFFHGATSFFELKRAWGEGDGLANEAPGPGEVSWTYSEYAQPWAVPGASDPAADRSLAPVMRTRVTNGVGVRTVVSGEAFVELVRQWAEEPETNFGVLFEAEDPANQPPLKIASREHSDPAFRPRLVVELLPEPGVAPALAGGIALLALLARRRGSRPGCGSTRSEG